MIAVVAGTRPEFIKLAPIVQELQRRGESPIIIATGQHTDLLRGTPFEDGMAPDVDLKLPSSNDPIRYAGLVEVVLRDKWARDKPDTVVVQGDTASAYAGALAANQLDIEVAHIEAGIRTGDFEDPFPEEKFRVWIDGIAHWHFCATQGNWDNVLTKWDWSFVTGNPGIDALYSHTRPVEQSQKVDRVLITLHRRESFGKPLRAILKSILRAAERHPALEFLWPVHPNPRVREAIEADTWEHYLPPANLNLVDPLPTVEFAQMLATSRAVITDSGGVQEEAAALGIPAVIAREKTDRPESVELGLAKVVGRTAAGILAGLKWALDTQIEPSTVFGDGHASERIVGHLLA